ncbi:MAG TPA: hypothetical protein VMU87_05585 [Stellaceae bacterium]|nr:hypothetical protein [Stellaceae bacterium]
MRLLRDHIERPPDFRSVDLHSIAGKALFDMAERRIHADSIAASLHPTAPDSGVRMTTKNGPRGQTVNEFSGRPSSGMARFSSTRNFVSSIIPPSAMQS